MRDRIQAGAVYCGTSPPLSCYLRLGRDIDASSGSSPLSSWAVLEGSLDGAGFTISNLTRAFITELGVDASVHDLSVHSTTQIRETLGLLAHINNGSVSRCHASGEVTTGTTGQNGNKAGLLIGDNRGLIENSSSSGSISGRNWLGGLVGRSRGTIVRSFSSATVNGGNRVGGLLGSTEKIGGTVLQSYATGSVTGKAYVGGLIGSIQHQLNAPIGRVENSYALSEFVEAPDYKLGGLVGINEGNVYRCYSSTSVRRTDAIPPVDAGPDGGDAGDSGPSFPDAQGLVGSILDPGTIIASYYNDTLTPNGRLGIPLSQLEMEAQNSFSPWDFATAVWKFDNELSALPVLSWQSL